MARICIIGGGAGGLATLKVLLETDEYKKGLWELIVFEARSAIGGVWLPSPPHGDPPASPLYESLTANLPHPVMAFSSFWFEPSTPLFPPAKTVLKYLQDYAAHFGLTKYVRCNIRVKQTLWDGHSWQVQFSDGTSEAFDRIVVANGHYHVPRYPSIPGLELWVEFGKVSHSVFYRNPQPYQGLAVLVIGNGPSGQDISAEASTVAELVYHSISGSPSEDVGKVKRRGRVVCFEDSGVVIFEDGSAAGIDHVILATGYEMSFPFLPQLRQSPIPIVPPLPIHALNSTYNVFPLAKHIFPLQHDFPADTLAFIGLLIRVAPFPLFEAQGRYIAKVFSHPGSLDKDNESLEVLARFNQLVDRWDGDRTTIAEQWHKLPDSEQFYYRRELLDFAESAMRWYPEDWVEEIYCAKGELRKAWVELERSGQAADWVRGVGEGGRHEWVSMMRRLLEASRRE